jgi:hypothetical protein
VIGILAEGARLLRYALKKDDLPRELRAVAFLWLAQTVTEPAKQRVYYTNATAADPNNEEARRRLAAAMMPRTSSGDTGTLSDTGALRDAGSLRATGEATVYPPPEGGRTGQTGELRAQNAPPAPPGGQKAARVNVAEYVACIIGGPNGSGTGFFVGGDNLLATTRRVVGALERVTVELYAGGQTTGAVVRAFPELDLALIRLDYAPRGQLPIMPENAVRDEAPLIAVAYSGQMLNGRQRPTKRAMPAYWIPTDFESLPDAGGDLLFDERHYFVGMMTRNTSRASTHFFGLHISAILRAAETYLSETRSARRTYCPHCGTASRALASGLFYCEVCGALGEAARQTARYPVQGAEAWYGSGTVRCLHCDSTVGLYRGRCLRCGREQVRK